MKQYLTIVAATLLLMTGCDRGLNRPGAKGDCPIRFEVSSVEALTRASHAVNSESALQGVSVGVFASYTGKLTYENTTVSPDYMYNQEVKYTAGHWDYTPVKLWPNDANDYVSFFAYAPYEAAPEEGSATGIIGMSRSVDLGDPWINFRLPEFENQVDLLYGQHRSVEGGTVKYTSWLDQQKYNWGEEPMCFVLKHALACIGDGVSVRMSDALYDEMHGRVDITFNSITITYRNLATKARLVLRSADTPNWKEIISGELTCSRTYNSAPISGAKFSKTADANPAAITLDAGNGLFYIPLQIAGTPRPVADIYLTYTIDNGSGATFTDVATASVPFGPEEAGTVQNFALTLNADFNLQATVVSPEEGVSMPGSITPTPGF